MLETFPSKLNPTYYQLEGKKIKEAIKLSFDENHIRTSGKGSGFRGNTLGCLSFSHNVKVIENDIYLNDELLKDDKLYNLVCDDYLQRGSGYPSLKVADEDARFDPFFIRDLVLRYLNDEEVFTSCKIKRCYKNLDE